MTVLRLLRATIAVKFYAWALREVWPLHPDVPLIARRHHYWTQQLKELTR